MLKPEYLDHVPDSMVELYSQAELDILKNMAERINKYDYYIPAAQWQAKKLRAMGMMHSDILKGLSGISGKSETELKNLMLDAGVKTIEADDAIHKMAGHKLPPLQASPSLMNVLNAGYRKTNRAFKNLTRTTAVNSAKQFGDALDQAHMQIISGAFDTETAVRNAIKGISKKGLSAVSYPSGHVDSIETAVRRATVTGVNQSAGNLQLARAADVGCNLVETTAHAGARPDHEVWQGKVFMLDGSSKQYPNFYEATGYGTGEGLCGWNCRHNFYPFYEGSEPAYTDDMLKDYADKNIKYNGKMYTEYEIQQIQRYYERTRRGWKREFVMAQAADLDTTEASVRLRSWMEREKELEKQTGLKARSGNMTAAGFSHAESKLSQDEARWYYDAFKKAYSINSEGMPKTLAQYYDLKYNNSPAYKDLSMYVKQVNEGTISPLLGFNAYRDTAEEIRKELIGVTTSTGVEINSYSGHFVNRILGYVNLISPKDEDSFRKKNAGREGVSVKDIKHCLCSGVIRKQDPESILYDDGICEVSVNPKTCKLIQTNPHKTKEKSL